MSTVAFFAIFFAEESNIISNFCDVNSVELLVCDSINLQIDSYLNAFKY